MRDKRLYIIAASTVTVLLIAITIAFAALASNINISFGNVTQNQLTWGIGFATGTVSGSASGTSDTGLSCGSATTSSSSVTISDMSLSKPGDKCTYALTINNSGDLAGKLSNIAATEPTSITCTKNGSKMVCGNITYTLTDTDGTLLTTDTILNPNKSLSVYLIASYTGEELSSTEVKQSGAKYTLTYTQSESQKNDYYNVSFDVIANTIISGLRSGDVTSTSNEILGPYVVYPDDSVTIADSSNRCCDIIIDVDNNYSERTQSQSPFNLNKWLSENNIEVGSDVTIEYYVSREPCRTEAPNPFDEEP